MNIWIPVKFSLRKSPKVSLVYRWDKKAWPERSITVQKRSRRRPQVGAPRSQPQSVVPPCESHAGLERSFPIDAGGEFAPLPLTHMGRFPPGYYDSALEICRSSHWSILAAAAKLRISALQWFSGSGHKTSTRLQHGSHPHIHLTPKNDVFYIIGREEGSKLSANIYVANFLHYQWGQRNWKNNEQHNPGMNGPLLDICKKC